MLQFIETLKVDNVALETQQKEILQVIQKKAEEFTEKIKKGYTEKIICQTQNNLNKTNLRKYYEFFYYKEGASEPLAVLRVDIKKAESEEFNKDDKNKYIYY